MGTATGRLPGLQSGLPIHSGAARNPGFRVLAGLFAAHYSGRHPTNSFRHPLHGRTAAARLLGGRPPRQFGTRGLSGHAPPWQRSGGLLVQKRLLPVVGRSEPGVILGPANYEALVIAGDRPLSPFWSPLPTPHDGKVSVASTRLAGSARHVVVPHTHVALPIRTEIIRQVVQFLRGDVA